MAKVVKFGGSSLSSSKMFEKVKNIVLTDSARDVVVASAIGKRSSDDYKITDLLYLMYAHIKYNIDFQNIFALIKERFISIKQELNLKIDLDAEFLKIETVLKENRSEEYLVSRGEYLTSKMLSEYIGYHFVDAKDVIFFDYDGKLKEDLIVDALNKELLMYKKIVVPGFYGTLPDGSIHLFSRGGSDVTGSIIARCIKASIYENFTDVSGFLVASPKYVKNPKQIKEITYEELRELSYMGANVLHEDTVFPVQEQAIPINIKNTNYPDDPGTIITSKCEDSKNFITGIAGREGFESLTIIKKQKASKIQVIKEVLEILDESGVSVEHIPSSIDSFSLIVSSNTFSQRKFEIINKIKKIKDVENIILDTDMALIAIVGRNMATKPGISARLFSIFGKENINIKVIAQASQELSIIVGVSTKQLASAIRAIYDELVR